MRSAGDGRQLDFLDVAERLADSRAAIASRGSAHLFGPGELVDADRGGDVGEVVLVARRDDPIVPASAARVAAPRRRATGRAATSCRMRSASAASSVTAMPPSPVVIVLLA